MDVTDIISPTEEEIPTHLAKKARFEKDDALSVPIPETNLKQPLSLEHLLNTRKVREYVKEEKDLVIIESTCKMSQVLKILIENQVHSAPVLDPLSATYIGFVDFLDILVWMIDNFPDAKYDKRMLDVIELLKNEDKWFTTPVSDVIGGSGRNPFHPINLDASLMDAVKIFGKGVHHIPVVDPTTNTFCGIISQRQIVQILSINLDTFSDLADKTLGELKLASNIVLFAEHNDLTLDTLRKIAQWKINGVPVVTNSQSKILIGNLSISDLRVVIDEHFTYSSLFHPLSEFISKCRRISPISKSPAVFCSSTDTLATAIKILASNHIHRTYVIDDNGKLMGVLTPCDIILQLLPSLLDNRSSAK